ncbi:MAG: PilZ domain-containing protein [Nitrospiraceae bacterium]
MESRSHPRYPVQFPIAILRNGIRGQGSTLNLSIAGCAMESSLGIQQGSQLAALLHLPDENPPMEVELVAVRWANGQKQGLQFLRLQPQELARLRQFVSSLERRSGGDRRWGR